MLRDHPSTPDRRAVWPIGPDRRAAVSIPANVAEGHNRRLPKPYRNHVNIALGSQAELETLLELTVRLKLLDAEAIGTAAGLLTRVGQMLYALQRSIKSSPSPR
jgi:four helix bundle protein